jgi:hypothetical protein
MFSESHHTHIYVHLWRNFLWINTCPAELPEPASRSPRVAGFSCSRRIAVSDQPPSRDAYINGCVFGGINAICRDMPLPIQKSYIQRYQIGDLAPSTAQLSGLSHNQVMWRRYTVAGIDKRVRAIPNRIHTLDGDHQASLYNNNNEENTETQPCDDSSIGASPSGSRRNCGLRAWNQPSGIHSSSHSPRT